MVRICAAAEDTGTGLDAEEQLRRSEDCFSEEIELDPGLSLTVFRVFQEALTNVARHADATRVTASLRVADGSLTLSVHDNGRGITQQEMRSLRSLGLIGIRERVRWCGGRFSIHGVAGRGTTVKVRIPIEKAEVKQSRESNQNHMGAGFKNAE